MITRAPTPRFQSGGRQSRIDILVREAVGWRTDELNRAGNIVPMKQRSTAHRRARGAHPRAPGDIAAELPVAVPREYTEPLPDPSIPESSSTQNPFATGTNFICHHR